MKEHKARIDLIQTQSRAVNEMYQTSRANEVATRRYELYQWPVRSLYVCIIQIFRLLHESGLLQKEPMKLFSKQETKMHTPNSKVELRRKPVRKQVTSRTASSRRSVQDTTLITSSPVNSELPNKVITTSVKQTILLY